MVTLNLIFYILIKKSLPFPNKKNERENAQNSKMYKMLLKSNFFTNFKSTCDDVNSFAKLAKKSHDLFSFDELFIFIYFG